MSSVWKDCKWGIIYLILIISIPFLPHADRWLKPKIDHESLRGLGLYVLGAGVGVLGLYLTRSRTESLRKQTEALEMQTEIEKSKNVTDAFAKSVELLGNKRAAARQGGIYALDKIAKDNPKKFHMTVIRIMASYVRKESYDNFHKQKENKTNSISGNEKLPTMTADIETAIEVIRQRKDSKQEKKEYNKACKDDTLFLDISNAYLFNADFSRAKLSRTNFSDSKMLNCIFDSADLSDSLFVSSDLKGSSFEECDLSGADLSGADLSGADLSKAKNLTREQISKAEIDEDTILPPGIKNSQDRSSSEQI
ncbi:pentapeptide repeat-containing protein [Candidatus Synechococcus spongiarum]|uniref:Pentapeptide repeat-containing protein n=1 Tax=Candidatus Synechococcus spongiarum LMB bulk15N TaxID=1943583 RepID=A0A1T1CS70_9SYNE|nr:pentapeptide repeat-containing protein [Candidatus Synechococcus spongiarum]OOV31273.1 hypothetical protein BV53_07195 [Candidatus Synechococcus spongiarum LMB bulk15N]